MANIAEIIIRAIDEASGVLANLTSSTESVTAATQVLSREERAAADEAAAAAKISEDAARAKEEAYKGAALAITGVGAAGLAVLETTRKLNADFAMTAMQVGITEDAMRELAIGTADAGLSLAETQQTFDLLVRAGIECEKEMASLTKEFDTLADATGSSAIVVAQQMIPTMNAFGINLTDAGKHMDTFTWLSRETTVGMDEFSGMMAHLAPEIDTLGISLEQSVAVMAALEAKGITGAAATRQFRSAVGEADGSLINFYAALGLSETSVAGYVSQIEEADGMTEQFADVSERQFGIVAHLTSAFEEAKFGVSGMLAPLEGVMVGMTTVAPLIHAAYAAQELLNGANIAGAKIMLGKMKVALVAMVAKLKLMAIGLGAVIAKAALILAPIALVVGALYLLEKEFGVVTKAVEFAKVKFTELIGFLSGMFKGGIVSLSIVFETVLSTVRTIIDTNVAAWTIAFNLFSTFISGTFNAAISVLNTVFETTLSAVQGVIQFYIDAWIAQFNLASAGVNMIFEGLSSLIDIIRTIFTTIYATISTTLNNISVNISTVLTEIHVFFTTKLNEIFAITSSIFTNIHSFVIGKMNAVSVFISETLAVIYANILTHFNNILTTITSIITNIHNFVVEKTNAVSAFLNEMLTLIYNAFLTHFNNILTTVTTVITNISNFITENINTISAFISGSLATIYSTFSTKLNEVFTLVSNTFNNIYNTIYERMNSALSFLNGLLTQFTDTANLLGGGFLSGITAQFDIVNATVQTKINNMLAILTGMVTNFTNAGQSLGTAFFNGIDNKIDDAVDAVRDAAKRIRRLLPSSDAKEGPLSDLTASGEALMKTFASGMEGGLEYPNHAMQGIVPPIPTAGAGVVKGGQVQNITNNITQTFNVTLSKDYSFADMMRDKNIHDKLARMQRGI